MDKIHEYYKTLTELSVANARFMYSKDQYIQIFHEGYAQAMSEAIEILKQMFGLGEYGDQSKNLTEQTKEGRD